MKEFFKRYKTAPTSQALVRALQVLAARARFEGEQKEVWVRVAEHGQTTYVDLGDEHWRAVEIDENGWRVVNQAPVLFRRPVGLLALPEPVSGGTLGELVRFINFPAEDERVLFTGALVAALRPRGPHFLLELAGEQGTGKTTAQRIFKSLTDPAKAPVRSEPREERDLMIAASNGWVIAFDNLSRLEQWLSDALCRLSTGGGFSTRQLYSDADETIFDAQRPCLITGIEQVVARGDLLDRTISIQFQPISSRCRLTETELWKSFDDARPRLLGALYSAVSSGIALMSASCASLEELPRMADAVAWVNAAEPALEWELGMFRSAYNRQRVRLSERALQTDVLGLALLKLLSTRHAWSGTATELLRVAAQNCPEHMRGRLPMTPAALGQKLRRLSPDLRASGIELDAGERQGHQSTRIIHLRKTDSPDRAVRAARVGYYDFATEEADLEQ